MIACNSASAAAFELVKEYVGSKAIVLNVIDPAIDYVRDNYKGKEKGLIGTKRTVFSEVYKKEVFHDSLNHNYDVITIDDYIKNAAKAVRGLKVVDSRFTNYEIYTGYNMPSKTVETYYHDSGDIVKTTTQKYDLDNDNLIDYYMPTSVEAVGSDGVVSKSNTTYVFNKASKTSAEQDLESKNALYLPLESESFKGTELLGKQYTVYNDSIWTGLNVPEKVQASKGSNLEDRIIYNEYDSDGNILEVSKKDGTSIVYLYGYDNSLPIAKIENASFSDVPTSVYTSIQNASNNDTSVSTENTLRSVLANLRDPSSCPDLTDAMITTFTYDPLVGVTSVTDPRGKTIYYNYDDYGRLQYVKDHEGKILSENEYNYKQ